MQAGALDQRVTLQQRQSGVDAIGQPVQGWSAVATVWADVRHVSGLEAVKADAAAAMTRASIRIRWRAGVDAGMRVVHGSTAYEIRAVLGDRRAGRLDLVCEAINAQS